MFKIFVNAETASTFFGRDLDRAELVALIKTGVIDEQQKEGMLALQLEVLTASKQGIVYARKDAGRTEEYFPVRIIRNNKLEVEERLLAFLQEHLPSDAEGELKIRLHSDNHCDLTVAFVFVTNVIPAEYSDEEYSFWYHHGMPSHYSVVALASHLAESALPKTDAMLAKAQQRLVSVNTMIVCQLNPRVETNHRMMQVLQAEQRALHDYRETIVSR